MKVLSHRGYWKTAAEKNTALAFTRSFELGFGTETDVRDLEGELVISHDPARHPAMALEHFLALHARGGPGVPLAINVKADGLAGPLAQAFQGRDIDWFAFDMSIPDTRQQLAAGNPVFMRMSEFETVSPFFDRAAGVWLDAFDTVWWTTDTLRQLLDRGLRVCVVSPELHGREHADAWKALAPLSGDERLLLCTDIPEDAWRNFHSPLNQVSR